MVGGGRRVGGRSGGVGGRPVRPVRLVGVHCEEVRLVNRVVVSPEGDNVVALHPAEHVPEVWVLVGGPEAGEAKGRVLVVVEGGGKGGG